MKGHSFPLQNRGMSRDISVSKADNTLAFDNHNIRIESRDHDTLLSVTNERGNKEITDCKFTGDLIGYNVLNEYIIIFTHSSTKSDKNDRIYRIKYNGSSFDSNLLFKGSLGLDLDHPIESIVSYETPSVQKIYWVDGKNVLRFINFVDKKYDTTLYDNSDMLENGVNTTFDVNRGASFNINVDIRKTSGGQNRPNGVVQYIVTYYNKNGIQTSYVYISDLIYLTPDGRGGEADGHNTNAVKITLSNLDSSFDYVRVYSIVRTSYNGTPSAYIVGESSIDNEVSIIDNGAHLEAFDYTELLFLGSKRVVAGTLTHKDGTLFLGDLKSIGNSGIDALEKSVKDNAFKSNASGRNWESAIVRFELTNDKDSNIPYVTPSGLYPYKSQLDESSSRITTFKGGEKYRFALRFRRSDGTESDAMWIGDKVNEFYPMIDSSDNGSSIRRAVAICDLSSKPDIIKKARDCGFVSVTLCIAKADYSDRSVMAQGIVSPTVFNNWSRFNNAPFLQSSWIFRPRKSNITNRHYSVLKKSSSPYGELQSNWWEDSSREPMPYYYLEGSDIVNKIDGMDDFSKYKFVVEIVRDKQIINLVTRWYGFIWIVKFIGTGDPDIENGETGDKYIDGRVVIEKRYIGFRGSGSSGIEHLRARINDILMDNQINHEISESTMESITEPMKKNHIKHVFYGSKLGVMNVDSFEECIVANDWDAVNPVSGSLASNYSRYTRNLFFVDEHAVTMNSPEIHYEKVNVDNASGLKFRIVGLSKMTGNISDYNIDYSNGHMSGEHVNEVSFSKQNITIRPDGLTAWPLFFESSLFPKEESDDYKHPVDRNGDELYDYSNDDYAIGSGIVTYMMNMWHHSGSIPECYNENNDGYSVLDRKLFANLRYSYYTLYNDYKKGFWEDDKVNVSTIRQFNSVDKQLMDIRYDGEVKEYSGTESQIITMPGFNRYPIFKTNASPSADEDLSVSYYMRSQSPVSIEYRSNPHALICFGNDNDGQIVLPKTEGMVGLDQFVGDDIDGEIETAEMVEPDEGISGPFLPWSDVNGSLYAVTYLNKTSDYAYSAEFIGDNAYLGYDINLSSGLINSKKAAGSGKFYMLLKANEEIKFVTVGSVADDQFTVRSFSADVKFARKYITGGYIQIIPTIETESLVIDGNQIDEEDYTIKLKCFYNGRWIDADSVALTNEGNFTEITFRIDLEYTHPIYGHCLFSTDEHIEKLSEVGSADTDSSGDLNEGVPTPYLMSAEDNGISLYKLENIENDGEDVDDGTDGDQDAGGEGTGTPGIPGDTPQEGEVVKDRNKLITTYYSFEINNKSFNTSVGKKIKIHCSSIVPFDDTFDKYIMARNRNSDVVDMKAFDVKGSVTTLRKEDYYQDGFSVSPQVEFKLLRDDSKYFGRNDEYMFIGELYYDYDSLGDDDPRYGGTDENDVEANVFIDCSKTYSIKSSKVELLGNMGDTYFQRWDCVKTIPYSRNSVNGVIDIASFMVETHINLDGRTDLDRGRTTLASIDYDNYGSLNPVYSQENNFIQSMDTDSAMNEDSYETSITWTLEKHDGQEIDPWTHITLASMLSLDGDKGRCNALTRLGNTIIAFQDRGICEVMFNSRTQLSTENGVPIEIANSGKVDGKRYISNKYGCTNKWSIAEGKSGLYFVDNINKIIVAFNGESIVPLSTKAKFDTWVRKNNVVGEWTPNNRNAFRTFYDRIHSDIYFINSMDPDNPCLVYNEMLDSFTSFFDYKDVPMMVNVSDRFISYKGNHLYLQNEGDWCSIFGEQKPFWMTWKVMPEPYSDKIWTNIEYRADFFDNPDTEDASLSEKYIHNATFDKLVVENEYQRGEMNIEKHTYPGVEKKFRIWRLDIPRDLNSKFCMDRIRNPWVFVTLRKDETKPNEMMSLNDVIAKYFSEE